MSLTFYRAIIDSPIQPLAIAFDEAGALRALSFEAKGDSLRATMAREYPGVALVEAPVPAAMAEAFAAYFAGDRAALERIPWSLEGAAGEGGFQARVWVELTRVPAGQTISYAEMAKRAGGSGPEAARAAGVALNRNPIALVLACHRVVGADGAMTGFGGGLERKTWLLRHEGALLI
ncbi:methylated-DNA--[protein]-cysteine S-methyltransferase [Brevundimonas goettingensis]|jgi:methylated-DNA-[protein]-cysteine S-methyltransferase|uniref:methylated-DNA--[protein]-cysteine S-methyltransferase n=1 Tax=Brevundimonas goettingensis TaxID=2774190 RepID=A0A975BZ63_9CAUL|nr:methylated-DNA--[protein]-cysteine S-methyltransferase [Brevundimonas goettingensis]QTC90215.1 methylated-DNA--[protein]-cysteine S-methyltransferase [Brevundimonas goettingensis]